MNKKIIGVLIFMLLFSTAISSVGLAITQTRENTLYEYIIIDEEINYRIEDIGSSNDEEVDQSQETSTGSERIQLLSGGIAQSFVPSVSPLVGVAVLLTKSSGQPEFANYYIEIRPDIHNPAYYMKVSIPGSEFTSLTNFWLKITFSDITVNPGSTYWIVCYADNPTIYSTQVKWCFGSPGDPYPSGNSMYNTMLGWGPYDLWGDFCFRTYKPGSSTNNPPNTPSTPSGPTTGNVGESYTYTTSATDPDGDDISYGWDWDGDSITDEYSGFLSSGSTCTMTHSWSYPGTYNIKVKAKDENFDLSAFSPTLTVTISEGNNPPNKPSTPSGPSSGKSGTSYSYSVSTTDPEGDDVYYWFDWGDSQNTGWVGPHSSGSAVSEAHIWSSEGTFPVKVKAKDVHGEESIWSDSLSVTMPKTKLISNPLLQILRDKYPLLFQILNMYC